METTWNNKESRVVWIDWLRVLACFMVMVVHSTEPFYLGGNGSLIASASDTWWVALSAYSAMFRQLLTSTPLVILLTAVSSFVTVAVAALAIRRIPAIGKYIVGCLAAAVMMTGSAFGAAPTIWTDAATLPVYGKITDKTSEPFSRLPEYMKETARPAIWSLGRNSSGLYVKFTTDAEVITLRWKPTFGKSLDNMPDINTKGLDLYIWHEGKWQFIGNGRPKGQTLPYTSTVSCTALERGFHEFMLYLSMYDGVRELEIGVPEGCTLKASDFDNPKSGRPVVMYGTSILQGGSSSRPGRASTNILSRMLNCTVINLGFSGNAHLDSDVAKYMASCPEPAVFVLDNLPNCNAERITAGQETFFHILRDAHPDVPVVFVENPVYPRVHFDAKARANYEKQQAALKAVFDKLKKDGEKNIYYVKGDKLLGDDTESTIDGTHFTDLGYMHYVEVLYPVLKKLIKP